MAIHTRGYWQNLRDLEAIINNDTHFCIKTNEVPGFPESPLFELGRNGLTRLLPIVCNHILTNLQPHLENIPISVDGAQSGSLQRHLL